MSIPPVETTQFSDLKLNPLLLKSLSEIGYETPSPIQVKTIPSLLEGKDLVGQAQTGTGKTAAFALPLLSRLDLTQKGPLALVLTPTRELAIQVAEAFQRYARHLKNFHVMPVYGGSDMSGQIRQLKRGVNVVVGTPGRVMDHMRRGTLKLNNLQALVLDEADEMLRMGFIDDVEWVLTKTPATRQIALFSATMPTPIRKIARKYLNSPEEIIIKSKTSTVDTTNQRYYFASGMKKLDALTRILETEDFDAVLVFVRTKLSTALFAEKLAARGYACAALSGDVAQRTREKTIDRLKSGDLDIVVATDVAARGLDVDRISHVINFDIPRDIESYVHRIGRTGRAGRRGEAILFITPREKYLLAAIEKATKQRMTLKELPTKEVVLQKRRQQLKEQVQIIIDNENLDSQMKSLEQYQKDWDWDLQKIAAGLLKMVQTNNPVYSEEYKDDFSAAKDRKKDRDNKDRPSFDLSGVEKAFKNRTSSTMQRYRVEVGLSHGIQARNFVGACCNEAGLSREMIGRINLYEKHSMIELPKDLPQDLLNHLKKVWVGGQQLQLSIDDGSNRQRDSKGGGNRDRGERRERSGDSRNSAKFNKPKKFGKSKDNFKDKKKFGKKRSESNENSNFSKDKPKKQASIKSDSDGSFSDNEKAAKKRIKRVKKKSQKNKGKPDFSKKAKNKNSATI
ncbi:hypothetical protein BVY03_04975 [bacterium K02(2017)]|nr:hypothetical protein BVY03_04975 [bacterium K02(2017)]